jgi:hypothetical protein
MGRVVDNPDTHFDVPVLTSPRLGMERVAEWLRGQLERAA